MENTHLHRTMELKAIAFESRNNNNLSYTCSLLVYLSDGIHFFPLTHTSIRHIHSYWIYVESGEHAVYVLELDTGGRYQNPSRITHRNGEHNSKIITAALPGTHTFHQLRIFSRFSDSILDLAILEKSVTWMERRDHRKIAMETTHLTRVCIECFVVHGIHAYLQINWMPSLDEAFEFEWKTKNCRIITAHTEKTSRCFSNRAR